MDDPIPDVMRPTEELLPLLADAFEQTIAAAVDASGVDRPFTVVLYPGDGFQPFLRIGGDRFRTEMTTTRAENDAALDFLHFAQPPDGAVVLLLPLLGPDAARACRELAAAHGGDADAGDPARAQAQHVLEGVGLELSARLNRREWPGVAHPFLALVHFGADDAYDDERAYALATTAVGEERVTAFRAALRSSRRDEPALAAPPSEARTDRDALERLLVERGLGEHAHTLAHDVATPGLSVVPRTGGRSRLGGPPLLPPGERWPHDDEGRPLTFLAGIDLSELPVSGPLPDAGWLLFFADIDNEEAEGLVDDAENVPGSKARVYVLSDDPPVPAASPATLPVVLHERSVGFVSQLTLPDDYDAPDRLGLNEAESDAYDTVTSWLRTPDEEDDDDADLPGEHWVLGSVCGPQGHPPDDATTLLLHIGDDRALGFDFLDAGAIQFRIGEAALEDGEWSAIQAVADSH